MKNTDTLMALRRVMVVVGMASAGTWAIHAFPPALHQEVFGMIRDERGNPLSRPGSEVVMEVGTAAVAKSSVATVPVNGANYRLVIP